MGGRLRGLVTRETDRLNQYTGTRLSQGQAEAMINAADTNGDGVLGYEGAC